MSATATEAGAGTTVDIVDPSGAKAGSVELPGEIFGVAINIPLIHQVVVAQQAAARSGTHATKTRGEVRGGGRKPYRQKGTGRARQGSSRAPQFTGGGIVHGPVPRSYAQRTPKKMKAAALRGALSDRARGGKVHVLSGLVSGDTPSTRDAIGALNQVGDPGKALVVVERTDVVGWKSVRNVPDVHVIAPDQLNTYDVLVADDIVFTAGALQEFLRAAGSDTEVAVTLEKKPAKKAPAKKAAAKKAATAEESGEGKPTEEPPAAESTDEGAGGDE